MRVTLLGTIVLASLAAASGAGEWPRFRGPNGSGVSDAAGLPVEFGPGKNVVWKTAVPFGRSSPVIAGGRIFLTASDGEKLITLCLDERSGRVRWRREIARPRAAALYKNNDAASPSPVTDGKNVYAFFPDLGLVSYGPKGKERWRLPLGPFDNFYGLAASPVLHGGMLLLVCDSAAGAFLAGVDAGTGQVRWRAERPNSLHGGWATPVVHEANGEPQLIVLGAHAITAYTISNGERAWWMGGLGYLPVGSPVIGNGVLLFSIPGSDEPEGPGFELMLKSDTNGDGRIARDEAKDFDEFGGLDFNRDGYIERSEWDALRKAGVGAHGLMALRLGGRGDLTKTGPVWSNKKNYDMITSVVLYKDVIYGVKTGGIIASIDPLTGEAIKVDRTKDAMETYYASPVAAGGKIIFASESGKVTVVKAGRQWEILAVNDLGEECYATPAIAGRRIFVRTRGALYAFGSK